MYCPFIHDCAISIGLVVRQCQEDSEGWLPCTVDYSYGFASHTTISQGKGEICMYSPPPFFEVQILGCYAQHRSVN